MNGYSMLFILLFSSSDSQRGVVDSMEYEI